MWKKWKADNRVKNLNLNILTITLNINEIHVPVKRSRLAD